MILLGECYPLIADHVAYGLDWLELGHMTRGNRTSPGQELKIDLSGARSWPREQVATARSRLICGLPILCRIRDAADLLAVR